VPCVTKPAAGRGARVFLALGRPASSTSQATIALDDAPRTSLRTGSFDLVHQGHQASIEEASHAYPLVSVIVGPIAFPFDFSLQKREVLLAHCRAAPGRTSPGTASFHLRPRAFLRARRGPITR
jgi:hypothetical protein